MQKEQPAGDGGTQSTPFADHPLRAGALQEIHARPFHMVQTPRVVLHYAFMTDHAAALAARDDLSRRCRALGVDPPDPDARHHVVAIGDGTLRWETHAEFTTYSWDMPPPAAGPAPTLRTVLGDDFAQPGPLMVATRLDLVDDPRPVGEQLAGFDPGSVAVSAFRNGRAVGATDFRVDAAGVTRIRLVDRSLAPQETGPLVQRLIEIETYRTLALLGLPEARRQQPGVARIEAALTGMTDSIRATAGLDANRRLLEEMTAMAAELEAGAAASAYRFAATRAYAEIVRQRLASVREGPVDAFSRWSSFLERRMAPALRTCESVERRQADLSERLSRAANLLRTRIDVELEQQNRELLASMNRRARMQLRLQQTVEGLSVAAVSYYVVGLIGYLAKGVGDLGIAVDPNWITALSVPPVILVIWLLVRRIRARHGGGKHEAG